MKALVDKINDAVGKEVLTFVPSTFGDAVLFLGTRIWWEKDGTEGERALLEAIMRHYQECLAVVNVIWGAK